MFVIPIPMITTQEIFVLGGILITITILINNTEEMLCKRINPVLQIVLSLIMIIEIMTFLLVSIMIVKGCLTV